jgi:hypothetical protein
MACSRVFPFPLLLHFQSNIQLALTFDLGADKIHLIAVGWSSSKESNPVAVTHAAPVHLRYLVVTTKPMPNLQHEQQRYVMIHIYNCVLKRQLFNCYHMRVFLNSVLTDSFCCEWRKPRPLTVTKGGVLAQIRTGSFQNARLEGYNKGLGNF